jgi:ElaB/YqjD/DUF883 family membrane-anchored ribosome-binding protein
MQSNSTQAQYNHLTKDLQNVVTDAEELLKAVGHDGSAKLSEVKTRVQASLSSAKATLGEVQETVRAGAQKAIATTDTYVHEHPWHAVGVGAALGLLVGFLAARR